MSKATRMLAMAGMALVAGATFSAGPAAASTVHGTTSAAQSGLLRTYALAITISVAVLALVFLVVR